MNGNTHSCPFPSIKSSDPFPHYGNGCFHSLPVPEFWEWVSFIPFPFLNLGNGIFSFPSRSRILGMGFFHSLPIPEIWEWIFLFPSRSRISGMGFFNSLPFSRISGMGLLNSLPVPEPSKVIPAHPCMKHHENP